MSAAEAGHEPADGRLQLALVEEAEGGAEDAEEEEEDRQVAVWSDTRELQDLFLAARPTWKLADVESAVSKLQQVGITTSRELYEALEAGKVNTMLEQHWNGRLKTFQKATLRELKRCIEERCIPRRETFTVLEKRLDRTDSKFRRDMEKFVEDRLDEWVRDSEERLRKKVDRHVDEQLEGELDRLYARWKKHVDADFDALDRTVNRRLEELSRRLDELEPDRGQRRETGSPWQSGLSSVGAPNGRCGILAIAGSGQLAPTSPRRGQAKGEAEEVAEGRAGAPQHGGELAQEEGGERVLKEGGERDRQGQDLERLLQESEALRSALEVQNNRLLERLAEFDRAAAEEERRCRQLMAPERESLRPKAMQHRCALSSETSSVDDRSIGNFEHFDDSMSEPMSSRDACQPAHLTDMQTLVLWKTALKTEITALKSDFTASMKEVVQEGLQEAMSKQQQLEQDDVTMTWLKGGPNEMPMIPDNISEASCRMQHCEDGTLYEQPTTEKPRLGLIRELASVGGDWETGWSEAFNARFYRNKKTGDISYIMPEAMPENYSDEPEVVVSTPRPTLVSRMPETPEETRAYLRRAQKS